jgi:hypothetical protein
MRENEDKRQTYLLLILFLEAENNLNGYNSFLSTLDLHARAYGYCRQDISTKRNEIPRSTHYHTLRRILINMSRHLFLINLILRNPILICSHSSNNTQGPTINLAPPIADNTNHNLLPPFLSPRLTLIPRTQMRNILDNAMHRATKEFFVLVVHRHDDKELGPARRIVEDLTEREAFLFKVVGIASRTRVPEMGEFALGTVCAHVEEFGGNGLVKDVITVE